MVLLLLLLFRKLDGLANSYIPVTSLPSFGAYGERLARDAKRAGRSKGLLMDGCNGMLCRFRVGLIVTELTAAPTYTSTGTVPTVNPWNDCCVMPEKNPSQMSTEEVMETRRRISDSKLEKDGGGAREGARSTSFASGGESDDASRSGRVGSGPERKLKVRRCLCVWCISVFVGRGARVGGCCCCVFDGWLWLWSLCCCRCCCQRWFLVLVAVMAVARGLGCRLVPGPAGRWCRQAFCV